MKYASGKSAILALVLALIMIVVVNTATPASAADTGFAVPSSYADIDGYNNFNQPDEGRVSDDSCAVETGGDNCSVSYYGFAFSVPSSTIIDGIVITVQTNTSPGSDKSLDVSLSYDNGTSWTATQNTGIITTSDNIFYTVGGAADTWGYTSWTPNIINSDYFRVRLDVSGTSGNVKIDSTQAMVYYSVPGTTTTVATSRTPSTYGDSVTFTATVTRSGGSDTPSGTVTFTDGGATIGSGTLSGSGGTATATFATSSLAAGSHAITAVYGGSSSFSGSTSSPITQGVNRRNITLAADAQSKVYGDPDPALTYQITSGSLVGGDGFTGAPTRVIGEAVGTYAIQQGTLALSSNYNLTYVEANLSITVRPITVTADAQSKAYRDFDPALTYQITSGSLVFDDTFSGFPSRVAGMAIGTYAIQQGTLALNSNYDLTFVESTLTIMPPAPTLDGIGPDSGHAGETFDIIIHGSGFTGATAVNFGPGVTVNSFVVHPTRITANVTIDSDASLGPRDVIVTTPSGDGTLTEAFSITKNSSGILGSWWFWLLMCMLALALGLLLFLLFRCRKKETLWDVRARHAYTPVQGPGTRTRQSADSEEEIYSPSGNIRVLQDH